MRTRGDRLSDFRSLMQEALHLCILLQNYTDENFHVLMSDDDEKIIEIIDKRAEFIDSLADIDSRIDALLDDPEEDSRGESLPPDAEDIRRSVRAVLSDISAKDMELMMIISGRMQTYRNETLKARSKQSLSAYIRSAEFARVSGDSIDFTN
jgi:hypothetical protein